MAKSLLFTLGLFLAVGTVQAIPNKHTKYAEEENSKYGIQVNRGIHYQRLCKFLEYKVHQKLGIQSGLFLTFDNFVVKDLAEKWAGVETLYIGMPLTLCFYPGKDRQSCLFAGGEIGYVMLGKIKPIEPNEDLKIDNWLDVAQTLKKIFKEKTGKEDIKQRPDKRDLAFSLCVGYSYEFKDGFFVGTRYTRGLTSVIPAEETFLNWSLHVHTGWNFAPFIALFNR